MWPFAFSIDGGHLTLRSTHIVPTPLSSSFHGGFQSFFAKAHAMMLSLLPVYLGLTVRIYICLHRESQTYGEEELYINTDGNTSGKVRGEHEGLFFFCGYLSLFLFFWGCFFHSHLSAREASLVLSRPTCMVHHNPFCHISSRTYQHLMSHLPMRLL